MSGLKLVIPYAVSDKTIPILRDDLILAPGSLMLLDTSNGSQSQPAVIPAGLSTGLLPNIAWKECAAVLGTGDAASLAFSAYNNLSGTNGKFEITSKKGLHSLISQVNHTATSQNSSVRIPLAIRNYIAANPTHKYYVSTWVRQTRSFVTGIDFGVLVMNFSTTGNYNVLQSPSQVRIQGQSAALEYRDALAVNDLNPQIRNKAINALTGTPGGNGNSDLGFSLFANGGGLNAYGSVSVLNKCPSMIMYRAYIEDLTVSGRTYATVDAIDKQMYDAAFAVGGKFYGDSFTDPTTIA